MEEKLKQFIAKWNGKKVEAYDNSNLYQCYDLITQWCYEIGIKPPQTLYAYQIFSQEYIQFEKIKNEKDNAPQAGDIVVWSKAYNGTAGHTALATGSGEVKGKSSDWFEAFSQNDPLGSPSILKRYSFNCVLGWLRPKKEFINLENYYRGIDLNNRESIKVCIDTWHQVAVEGLFIKKEDHDKLLTEKDNTIANLNQQINSLNAENTEINKERNRLADELKICQQTASNYLDCQNKIIEITNLKNQAEQDLARERGEWKLKEASLNKKIAILLAKYNATKSSIKKLLIDHIFGKV